VGITQFQGRRKMNRQMMARVFLLLLLVVCPLVSALAQEDDISGGIFFYSKNSPPLVLTTAQVVYPPDYVQQKIEGSVELMVWVNVDGSTGEVKIKTPMKIEAFNDAALAAVEQYKFSPALQNGTPVGSWIDIVVNFKVKAE
jgi:TonB family protein